MAKKNNFTTVFKMKFGHIYFFYDFNQTATSRYSLLYNLCLIKKNKPAAQAAGADPY